MPGAVSCNRTGTTVIVNGCVLYVLFAIITGNAGMSHTPESKPVMVVLHVLFGRVLARRVYRVSFHY